MELSYNIYRPDDYAKGIIQIMHGMAEHSEVYARFANVLCKHGFVVVLYDHRGHGENRQEQYGFFADQNGWNHLVNDAYQISQLVKKEYPPNTPFILFGHSMGSIVARSYLKRYDDELDGLILCGAPSKESFLSLKLFLLKIICKVGGNKKVNPWLAKIGTGQFNKKIKKAKTPVDWLSYDEKNIERYLNDEQCGFAFTNRGYYDLEMGVKDIFDDEGWVCKNLELPILSLSGEDDPVTQGKKGREKTIRFLKKRGYERIKEIIYPLMRHEILQEKDSPQVIEDIVEWIIQEVCNKKI